VVELPYGRVPYLLDLGTRRAFTVSAAERPSPPPLAPLLAAALDAPIGSPRIEAMVRPGAKVTVIVSDATRTEPRGAFLEQLRARLPEVAWTIAVATGTHGPAPLDALGLPAHLIRDARIVNHDGHAEADAGADANLVDLGATSRGTPVRIHRCAVEADLVVATGCIRPHYFAGFGAGVKAIFPGLGAASAIRRNHELKTQPGARAGVVEDNPCREDLEEAVALVPAPAFLVNGVCGPDDAVHAAVAGDLVAAFRAGVAIARPWFTVRAPRAALVIASDALPVTASLYQAAKIAAAAAPLVAEGGTLALVAECADGIGPLDVVNEAIFRIGILPRLARGATLALVSSLPPEEVRRTLLVHAPSLEPLLRAAPDPVVVLPRASRLLVEVES
jgi:nickel-dependent lactate racemase